MERVILLWPSVMEGVVATLDGELEGDVLYTEYGVAERGDGFCLFAYSFVGDHDLRFVLYNEAQGNSGPRGWREGI